MRDPNSKLHLLRAIKLFNQQEYFASHDLLEEIWSSSLGHDREFLQGLIDAAGALFQLQAGQPARASQLAASAMSILDELDRQYRGIELEQFRRELHHCFDNFHIARATFPGDPNPNGWYAPQIRFQILDRDNVQLN